MQVEVLEIWAVGYKRYVYIRYPNGKVFKHFISDDMYKYLKDNGIPTLQSKGSGKRKSWTLDEKFKV